jgi:hypothetical protein
LSKPTKIPKPLSSGEEEFALHCTIYHLTPEREYVFHPTRKWALDFAWPGNKVAVEIEGGTAFGKSRHSRGAGFVGDCQKYNAAALLEWLVFRFTPEMVTSGEAIDISERRWRECDGGQTGHRTIGRGRPHPTADFVLCARQIPVPGVRSSRHTECPRMGR